MIYLDSTTDVFVTGLKTPDLLGGDYINDATVTGAIEDLDGTELDTFAFQYIPSTNGDYYGSITKGMTASLVACTEYQVAVIANGDEIGREKQLCDYRGYE